MFTPATKTGRWKRRQRPRLGVRVDDADEEVGGEERAEEHRLGGDEEEHAEHGRVDPRALVRDRRAVMRRCSACALRAHRALRRSLGGSTTTCSTGTFASLRSRADQVAPQPRGAALLREGRDEDRVDALVADGVHRRGERIGVGDLAVRLDPLGAKLRQRRAAAAAPPPGASPRSGSLCGQMIRKRARGARARAVSRIRSSSGSPSTVSFATTSTFSAPGARGDVGDDVLDRDGRRPPCGSRRAGCAAASPTSRPDGWRRSARRLLHRDRVLDRA